MIPLNIIVENELCTGCGVCVSECQSAKAKMSWSNTGFFNAKF